MTILGQGLLQRLTSEQVAESHRVSRLVRPPLRDGLLEADRDVVGHAEFDGRRYTLGLIAPPSGRQVSDSQRNLNRAILEADESQNAPSWARESPARELLLSEPLNEDHEAAAVTVTGA